MTRRFILSSPASRDLDEVLSYVVEHSGPTRGQHVLGGFQAAFDKLRDNPNLGHRRDDLTDSPLLLYRVWSWFIIYRFDQNSLEVARVLHAARDVAALLKNETF